MIVVISWIESIGGEVGGGGGWGAAGKLKQTFKYKGSAVPSVGNSYWHNSPAGKARSPVRINMAPHAVLLMPLRGHTGHEMYPRGLTALEKSRL